jgi:hypothetical protein
VIEVDAWRKDVVAWSSLQVGVRETTGNNDGDPARIYMRGLRCVPWCAYFVFSAYESAGIIVPGNWWLLGSVTYLEQQFQDHLFYESGGTRYYPRPADVVFFKNRGASDPSARGRHCGIVSEVIGSDIKTVEGNLGNAVKRSSHDIQSPRIAGFGWA